MGQVGTTLTGPTRSARAVTSSSNTFWAPDNSRPIGLSSMEARRPARRLRRFTRPIGRSGEPTIANRYFVVNAINRRHNRPLARSHLRRDFVPEFPLASVPGRHHRRTIPLTGSCARTCGAAGHAVACTWDRRIEYDAVERASADPAAAAHAAEASSDHRAGNCPLWSGASDPRGSGLQSRTLHERIGDKLPLAKHGGEAPVLAFGWAAYSGRGSTTATKLLPIRAPAAGRAIQGWSRCVRAASSRPSRCGRVMWRLPTANRRGRIGHNAAATGLHRSHGHTGHPTPIRRAALGPTRPGGWLVSRSGRARAHTTRQRDNAIRSLPIKGAGFASSLEGGYPLPQRSGRGLCMEPAGAKSSGSRLRPGTATTPGPSWERFDLRCDRTVGVRGHMGPSSETTVRCGKPYATRPIFGAIDAGATRR